MEDLQIKNNDLTFDEKSELQYLQDEDAVAQDLAHRLRTSGLHQQLIGETQHDQTKRNIQLELENDSRVEAGTVETTIKNNQVRITARLKNGAVVKI